MIRYSFREPMIEVKDAKGADPQKVGEALAKISEQNGGQLTPAVTVEAARPKGHILHAHFEWVDKEAAKAYRLIQAGQLIRSIRIIDELDESPRIAFLSIANGNGHSYYSRDAVQGSRDLQLLVLRQAERDLLAWQHRYAELKDICQIVGELREQIRERRTQLDEEPHPPA